MTPELNFLKGRMMALQEDKDRWQVSLGKLKERILVTWRFGAGGGTTLATPAMATMTVTTTGKYTTHFSINTSPGWQPNLVGLRRTIGVRTL
jgi:hypothetical protein